MKNLLKSNRMPILIIIFLIGYYAIGKRFFEITDNIIEFIIGSGFLVWLIQRIIDLYLTKKVESYKNDLLFKSNKHKLELDKDLNVYKFELDKDLNKHKLELDKDLKEFESKLFLLTNKYNLLHQQRLKILSKLYRRLICLNHRMSEMTRLAKLGNSGEDSNNKELNRINTTKQAYNEFYNYFDDNKIYFSIDLCMLIIKLIKEFDESLFDYITKNNSDSQSFISRYTQDKNIQEKFDTKVQEIVEMVENEFRKLLGVIENKE